MEVLFVTEHDNPVFRSLSIGLSQEFDVQQICLSELNDQRPRILITDTIRGVGLPVKTILYFWNVPDFPLSVRRQLQVRKDLEIFCASVSIAKLLSAMYRISAKIQPPYVHPRCSSEPNYIIFNRLDGIADELDEDILLLQNPDDLAVGKVYVHFPENELVNLTIPTAGSWGVPTVTADVGCLREVVGSGDVILPRDANIKQWVRAIKETIRDREEKARMAREDSKRWSNLDALVAKVKEQAHRKAAKKQLVSLDQELANIKQERVTETMYRNKNERIKRIVPLPPPPPSPLFQRIPFTTPSEYEKTPHWFQSYQPDIDVSIIVPLLGSAEDISKQIDNWDIMTDDGIGKEIIYIDDGCPQNSSDSVILSWERFRNTWTNLRSVYGTDFTKHIGRVIRLSNNSGFAHACNTGAKYAKGRILIFLNADTIVTPGWVKPIVDIFSQQENVGIVGNLQLKQDGSIDSAGSEWMWDSRTFEHIGRNVYHGKRLSNVIRFSDAPKDLLEVGKRQMVTGCCLAIPKNVFEEVGGFDITYRFAYWEDSDLNMKVRETGRNIFFQPGSVIYHKTGHSRAGRHPFMQDNARLFQQRWVETKKIEKFL